MRHLLDTHILLWWLDPSPRLPRMAHDMIADPESQVWVSVATIWEIAIKVASGRLRFPVHGIVGTIDRAGFSVLGINAAHAIAAGALPMHHGDPFDRLLIAQAQLEQVSLLTVDERMSRYGIMPIK